MIIRYPEKPVRNPAEWHSQFFWWPRRYTNGKEAIWIWLQTAQRRLLVDDTTFSTRYEELIRLSHGSTEVFHRKWSVSKDLSW